MLELLALYCTWYLAASVTDFQLRLTLSSVSEVTLSPVGAGALHLSVVSDTLLDGSPYVYEYGVPSPRARTRKL